MAKSNSFTFNGNMGPVIFPDGFMRLTYIQYVLNTCNPSISLFGLCVSLCAVRSLLTANWRCCLTGDPEHYISIRLKL